MKIPAKFYEANASDMGPWTLRVISALRIEAALYRKAGNRYGADAVRSTMHSLIRLQKGESFASAFDWPVQKT